MMNCIQIKHCVHRYDYHFYTRRFRHARYIPLFIDSVTVFINKFEIQTKKTSLFTVYTPISVLNSSSACVNNPMDKKQTRRQTSPKHRVRVRFLAALKRRYINVLSG